MSLSTDGDVARTIPFHLGYRPWLDGLRGIAILAVLAFHLNLIKGGFLGVDVFFVLSGFLITTLLIEEWQRDNSISLKRFYLRRALRLWPALFTLLFLCGIVSFLFLAPKAATGLRKEILLSACYVTNWPTLHGVSLSTLGHTWSLSIEEQFYLIWPILLYGMLRAGMGRTLIILAVGAGIIASAWCRAVLYNRYPPTDPECAANIWRVYLGLDTRADSLLVGCLAGLIVAWGLLPKSRRFQSISGVAALLSAGVLMHLCRTSYHTHHQLYRGLFTGVALMTAIILIRLVAAPSRLASWILEWRPVVGIGRISYALYLVHIPIMVALEPKGLGWSYPTETLLVLGLSFTAAIASWYGIERPCLRIKKRMTDSGPKLPSGLGEEQRVGTKWAA